MMANNAVGSASDNSSNTSLIGETCRCSAVVFPRNRYSSSESSLCHYNMDGDEVTTDVIEMAIELRPNQALASIGRL
uniref:Uncharacterized protein n=1 Tax=Plectus sambesii TaxID=2011161 RepID=A0A914WS96_9BILA